MAAEGSVKKAGRLRGKPVMVVSCKELKAAITREIKSAVRDRQLATRLINSLATEVAYGTGGGGGGGVGVA
jgi:hypothetical protein